MINGKRNGISYNSSARKRGPHSFSKANAQNYPAASIKCCFCSMSPATCNEILLKQPKTP